jgi:hypothetical protein
MVLPTTKEHIMIRFTVTDNTTYRTFSAVNFADAAEKFDTNGVLSLSGPDAVTVGVTDFVNVRRVTLSDGRALVVTRL